jgi:hypothetical protein
MPLTLDSDTRALFGRIRDLSINWSVLNDANASVSRINLSRTSSANLDSVFIAWYTRNGQPVLWPERGALPVTVGQAASRTFQHPRMHEEKMRKRYEQANSIGIFQPTMSGADTCSSTVLIGQQPPCALALTTISNWPLSADPSARKW